MKKLVKRLNKSMQSVEAYCSCSCQRLGCRCSGGYDASAGITASMEAVNQSITAQTSSGLAAN
ncbi:MULTISPECIES: CLI_3235 family bacteriocin precursor [Clostridium]|uniref:CLI_3235 family bacteriocin n=1 Tax=Clostridium cibarium TaxID=2762247 RepID=A0ABR8PWL4_9CLOT|nr:MULTISPECIES: CLI_3235 family bacteriocin precursor [Clostridium]MBD7912582.1 CLI_3235 family bacteriocin precursor [Clostridium cibarium]